MIFQWRLSAFPPLCLAFNTNRKEITKPKIAYVSTIAAKMIPFVACSGFSAKIWIPAAATFPWAIPENKPVKAIGREAPKSSNLVQLTYHFLN